MRKSFPLIKDTWTGTALTIINEGVKMDLKSVMNSEWGKSHIVFGSVSSAGIEVRRSETAAVQDAEKEPEKPKKEESKGAKLAKDIEKSISELEKKIDSPETEKKVREWLAFQGRFYDYSPNNTFWLAVQSMMRRTKITRVAGFRKWAEMEGKDGQTVSINKGEKGYSILYPQIHKYYEKDENGNFKKDENGEKIPLLDENGKPEERISYGVGYVFDVSQTNAVEIGAYKELNHRGEAVKIDPELVQEIAKRITAEYGIPVLFEENKVEQAGGWYMPSAHSITINTAVSKELSHQLGTLFHELGHGLMHGQNSANYSRSLKEGQAEAFAYACSMQFGVERNSELYIKGWIGDEVPLQDVMKDIASNIKDAFEKLKLQELILKQQMQTDVSVPENQNSKNQTAEKQTVTAEQQSSEKVSENAVFMLNKVFLLGANTAFSQKSNPRYKELCKACDYIQQMEQSDFRIAELYSIALVGERNNLSKERTGAEILNRVIEYQKLEKKQSEQKQDESQMMLF